MTANEMKAREALLASIGKSGGTSTAMQVLNAVSDSLHVGVPTVQRELYRLVSDGQIKMGESFRPVLG